MSAMCHLLLLSLGPGLGLQLLLALLHHIYPILWRSGILVSPLLCQVREKKGFPLAHSPFSALGLNYMIIFRLTCLTYSN